MSIMTNESCGRPVAASGVPYDAIRAPAFLEARLGGWTPSMPHEIPLADLLQMARKDYLLTYLRSELGVESACPWRDRGRGRRAVRGRARNNSLADHV
jgi:hypothetical protein